MCLCAGLLEVAAGAAVVAAVVRSRRRAKLEARCGRCGKGLEKHVPFGAPGREEGVCCGFRYPDPGAPEAVDAGCTCPVLDNAHGKGRGADGARFGWIVNGDCPLHGKPLDNPNKA